MKLREEVWYQKTGIVMTEPVYLYGKLFDLFFCAVRSVAFKPVNFRNECFQFMSEATVSPCFPVNIDVHNRCV